MPPTHDMLAGIGVAGGLASLVVSIYIARKVHVVPAIPDAMTAIWDTSADQVSRTDAAEAAVFRLAKHLRDLGVPDEDVRDLAYPVEPHGTAPAVW